MAWSAVTTSDSLTLISYWQTVLVSAAAMEISLNPGELASLLVKYNPKASPTDTLVVAFPVSVDGGTDWESDDVAYQFGVDNGADPHHVATVVSGVPLFRVRAKLSGATDTTSTLVVEYKLDGVSL